MNSISTGVKDDTDVAGGDTLVEATHDDHTEEKFKRDERDSSRENRERRE
ncbi:hypothetical protein TIFTF001_005233 [Ficus carica]|uniref:Uncharacterized protein n=1 Tax=Ficus carica TaxID=3494 RepID=A0AA88A716_FICCA|nr:hypothetical protein TIFTF001_005233 [Ficus carica]